MSAGFICLILFIMLSFWSLVVLFDQCLYVVILASVLSFFSFLCLLNPLSWAFFYALHKKKTKNQTKCTVVGRQAVHESFIIVEAMAVRTQGVELSWVEKHKYILLSHSAYISLVFFLSLLQSLQSKTVTYLARRATYPPSL